MKNTTTRSIATLAATGALVAGGAAAASATGDGDGDHRSGEESQRTEVQRLVHDAVEDGTVTIEEEIAIKQAIEDASDLEFESLDDVAQPG